jgi:UDP-glucose 4-epimerase
MKGKTIVITGGAGFIGSNLTRNLSSDNHVIVIDDLSSGNINNINDLIENKIIKFIKGSIINLDLLNQTFKNVDYVFHQAAITSVPKSIKDPVTPNKININGTLNVLIAANNNDIKKVIYASSSSVYGDTPSLPKKEEMTPCPLSPYAVSKLCGEYYCRVFDMVYELDTVSLRYFNVYGPRQSKDSEYAAVIPSFIDRILDDKSPIIFGDGNQTRDFTFIDDVIQGNIKAAESSNCGVFNIASGKRITINALAELIMKIIGKNLESDYRNIRPGDVKHSLADISKAKNQLNYQPKCNIKNSLKETVEWFQK